MPADGDGGRHYGQLFWNNFKRRWFNVTHCAARNIYVKKKRKIEKKNWRLQTLFFLGRFRYGRNVSDHVYRVLKYHPFVGTPLTTLQSLKFCEIFFGYFFYKYFPLENRIILFRLSYGCLGKPPKPRKTRTWPAQCSNCLHIIRRIGFFFLFFFADVQIRVVDVYVFL